MANQDTDLGSLVQSLISWLRGTPAPSKQIKDTPVSGDDSFGQKVLAAARQDLGVREDLGKNDGKRIREYFKYFGTTAGKDWCAAAVSAWMREAGGGPIPGSMGARNVGAQFQQVGRWVPRDKISDKDLVPGNIVVWARGGPDSWKGHIGVIESASGTSFTSIEGNSGPTSDSVVKNSHSTKDGNLLGVGILSGYAPKSKQAALHVITESSKAFEKLASKLGHNSKSSVSINKATRGS